MILEKKRLLSGGSFNLGEINRLMAQLHPDRTKPVFSEERDLREPLGDYYSHTLIAVDNEADTERYLGMATITFRRNLTKWFSEIHHVVVDSEYHSKGVGEFLIGELIKIATEFAMARKAPLEIYFISRPHRTAANVFYIKLGFELIGKAEGPNGTNLYRYIVQPSIKGLI